MRGSERRSLPTSALPEEKEKRNTSLLKILRNGAEIRRQRSKHPTERNKKGGKNRSGSRKKDVPG